MHGKILASHIFIVDPQDIVLLSSYNGTYYAHPRWVRNLHSETVVRVAFENGFFEDSSSSSLTWWIEVVAESYIICEWSITLGVSFIATQQCHLLYTYSNNNENRPNSNIDYNTSYMFAMYIINISIMMLQPNILFALFVYPT